MKAVIGRRLDIIKTIDSCIWRMRIAEAAVVLEFLAKGKQLI
jgi:hypothetical protein